MKIQLILIFFLTLILGSCTTTEEIKNDYHNLAMDVYIAYSLEIDDDEIKITKDGQDYVYIFRIPDKGIALEDLIEIQLDDETTLIEKEEFENGDGAVFNDKERGDFFEYRIQVGESWYRCKAGVYGPTGPSIKMIRSMRPSGG